MTKPSTILVPTDFTPPARQALDYAMHHYARMHSRLILLNAYARMPDLGAPMISLQDILQVRSEKGLREEYDYLLQNFDCSNLTIEQISRAEELVPAIRELAPVKNIGLIVMAASQRETDHMSLAQSAGRPVLLVPA